MYIELFGKLRGGPQGNLGMVVFYGELPFEHHPKDFPKYVFFENGKLVRMDEGQMRYEGILYPDFQWEAPRERVP